MNADGVLVSFAEEAEVLAAGEGAVEVDHLVRAQLLRDRLLHQIDHGAVVILEGVALLQLHLDVAAEGDADAPCRSG